MISINVIDSATSQLRLLSGRIQNPLPGLKIAGTAVKGLLRQHFKHKDSQPNKLGGERTHYWDEVQALVNLRQTGPSEYTVSVSHPTFMQKVKGGEIFAKRVRYLTIPISPEAHGRYASVLANKLGIKLFVVNKNQKLFLAGRLKQGDKSQLRFFYVLKKTINQKPDPTALPPEEEINKVAEEAFSRWMKSGGH